MYTPAPTSHDPMDSHAVPTKYCTACAAVLDARAEICPSCGVRQHGVSHGRSHDSDKNRMTAVLLAFFLGGFGAHKFYLGQTGLGILYLLFFWTFIPAIAAFVEFIIYLTTTDRAFAAKYG